MKANRTSLYPTDALSERIADGTVHAIGVIGALTGAILLIVWSAINASPGQIAAIAIYGGTLIATFAASAIYHLAPWEGIRPILRRLDHSRSYYDQLLTQAGVFFPDEVSLEAQGSWSYDLAGRGTPVARG